MHIKFNYRDTYAYNRIGVPSETILRKIKGDALEVSRGKEIKD